VAQSEYDNQVLLARASLATAHSRQEALAMSEQQLTETVVRAPTPTQPIPNATDRGIYTVSLRNVAEGSFVRAGAEAFRLVIDDTLKLRAAVPELSGSEVELGQSAEVFAATRTVTRINPVIDPTTRTFEVEIQIDNSRGELRPGGCARTAIHVRDDNSAAIPLEAVVKFAGITKIFLVKGGRAEEVQVTLGVQGDTWVEVASPALPRGAQVVTSGHMSLADGAPVEVRDTGKRVARKAAR
jgi:RND family efflux transporter MFP subunit